MESDRQTGRVPELLDQPGLAPEQVDRALIDLERVNWWLLGTLPVRRALLQRLCGGRPRQLLLDVGTGTGQVSAKIARAVRRRGGQMIVVGVDRKLEHLLVGRRRGNPQHRVVAAAEALPFGNRSFDWSVSTLFLHHFLAEESRRILLEMRRVVSVGAAVVDLRRSRLTGLLLRLLFPLLRVGPVARHDGYVSAEQAWTIREVEELVDERLVVELRRRFPFRFSLILRAGEGRESSSERA